MKETAPKAPQVIAVGGVIYRYTDAGKPTFLLIKKRGGYWSLPKGKLLPDENESDALLREMAEETGLTGIVGPQIGIVSYKIIKRGQSVRKQVTYYLVQYESGELHLSNAEQIIKAGWYGKGAALRRIRRGRLRVLLRRASELLGKSRSEE
jgi:8-oxo-dGTP diphosphatase